MWNWGTEPYGVNGFGVVVIFGELLMRKNARDAVGTCVGIACIISLLGRLVLANRLIY